MRRVILLLAPILVTGCTAPALQQSVTVPAGRDCFNVSFVQGYSSVGRNTVRFDLGPGATYDVAISGSRCDQVDWTQRLALESTPSSWICVGKQIGQGNIYFRDPTTRRRVSCYIEDVRRVTLSK